MPQVLGGEVMASLELRIIENLPSADSRYGLWEYSGYSAETCKAERLWGGDDLETLKAEAKQLCDSHLDAGYRCSVYFQCKDTQRLFIY